MATPFPGFWPDRRFGRTLLLGAVLGTGAVLAQAPAQPIEVWQGTRRLDGSPPAARLLELTPVVPVHMETRPKAEAQPLPELTLPPVPTAPPTVPWATSVEDLKDLARSAGTIVGQFRAAAEAVRPTPRAEPMPSPPIHVSVTQPPAPPAPEPPPPPEPALTLWMQIGLIAGAAVAGPLLLLIVFALLLRRNGIQLRVELLGSGPFTVAAPPVTTWSPLNPDGSVPPPPMSPAAQPETTAEAFDIGPTYEDERQSREMAKLQQEQAVLMQIFEENLRLREQIDALDDDDCGYKT